MAGPTSSNLPQKVPLRWSLYKAAHEFDVSESTLIKRLKDAHEDPGTDGCYATAQVVHAMYGSLHIERLRKLRAEADQTELENAITKAEYLHRGELSRGLTQLVDGILQIVNSSSLNPEEKADILNNIANFPVVLRDVAGRQTRLRSKERNGDHPEEKEAVQNPA